MTGLLFAPVLAAPAVREEEEEEKNKKRKYKCGDVRVSDVSEQLFQHLSL